MKILKFLNKEKWFIFTYLFILIVIFYFQGTPKIAMWLGFGLATFSAIANDSIQTLGTFLSSNKNFKWWILWIFIGGIFVLTTFLGWKFNNGDVAFGRLEKIPFEPNLSFFHILAPAILILITNYKIPVSTTFLIISIFATGKTINAMLVKTFIGYFLAFFVAIFIWFLLSKFLKNFFAKKLSIKAKKRWKVFQWLSTAFLWIAWLTQDTANVAVFLPRNLSNLEFLGFSLVGFLLIGVLFYFRGGKIQKIITEKKDVIDVRSATMIDITLAIILIFFKQINSIPMSTTWVFLGLLAGREIILEFMLGEKKYHKTLLLVGKDILLASLGLLISLFLIWLSRNF